MSRKEELINEFKRNESLDYLKVLKSLVEIPFPVGKKLLIDFLKGNYKNDSIIKNHLDNKHNFGTLDLEEEKLSSIIDNLVSNNLISISSPEKNKFWKVLEITVKGQEELLNPTLYKKKLENNFCYTNTVITDEDRKKFAELDVFLNRYNEEQKKAIISPSKNILCVAGAGSGKTTVLTKRIEFLVKYQNVLPEKILAITFTRKAREEMERRLLFYNVKNVNIETFNSFCEKILKKHAYEIYGKEKRVLSYGDKILAIQMALETLGIEMETALDLYFSPQQKKNKAKENLFNIFMNDCFFILDYFKSKNQKLYDFSKDADLKNTETAGLIYNICTYLEEYMEIQGFRDYADQLLDVISFFKKNQNNISIFEHILVDEYQDVNSTQVELLDLLKPKNLFCVGDPRQSIFGWRGSDINYILKFSEKYQDSEIITLTKNYRSCCHIVELINKSVKEMRLPDLEYVKQGQKNLSLLNFESEIEEFNFVINTILQSTMPKHEIFVLARTNRQLEELSKLLKLHNLLHIIKTDEVKNYTLEKPNHITLATIHAIKGLEAQMVFVIGCNELNFPCKAQDHPVVELIKIDEYDKEEEERRLFYVAMSRAKQILFLTYTGKKPTYFITSEMQELLEK